MKIIYLHNFKDSDFITSVTFPLNFPIPEICNQLKEIGSEAFRESAIKQTPFLEQSDNCADLIVKALIHPNPPSLKFHRLDTKAFAGRPSGDLPNFEIDSN
jgi:hypothetical protein